jgi:hypothetical protein
MNNLSKVKARVVIDTYTYPQVEEVHVDRAGIKVKAKQ